MTEGRVETGHASGFKGWIDIGRRVVVVVVVVVVAGFHNDPQSFKLENNLRHLLDEAFEGGSLSDGLYIYQYYP